MFKPGRLHRRLSGAGAPLFEVQTDVGLFGDDDIQSLTITRGEASPWPGISPSTLEFDVAGAPYARSNTDVTVRLTSYAASKFAYGPTLAAAIRDRFSGRRAQVAVEDVAWKAGVVQKFNSTFSASSWTSLIRNTARLVNVTAGQNIGSELVFAWNHPALAGKQPVYYPALNNFPTAYATEPGLSITDISGKYGNDLGIFFQHLRAGGLRLMPQGYRDAIMRERVVADFSILRSHTLSPAQWSTGIDEQSVQYKVIRRTSGGVPYEQVWPLPTGANAVMLEDEDIDLLHILPTSVHETFRYIANAKNNQANSSRQEIESIRLDMILLLSSDKPADRMVAAQVLALEAGDPVFLSGDWPQAVRAPYFANQIKETVNSDTWEIELTLFHPSDVLGLFESQVPDVPARVWDSAAYPWNTETRTWNQA